LQCTINCNGNLSELLEKIETLKDFEWLPVASNKKISTKQFFRHKPQYFIGDVKNHTIFSGHAHPM
jgi:hypothetical protein